MCAETYIKRKSKKGEYINLSCSFDIETTSFYDRGGKAAIMYAFVFGVNGRVMFGRTWKDLEEICIALKEYYGLNEKVILPV